MLEAITLSEGILPKSEGFYRRRVCLIVGEFCIEGANGGLNRLGTNLEGLCYLSLAVNHPFLKTLANTSSIYDTHKFRFDII